MASTVAVSEKCPYSTDFTFSSHFKNRHPFLANYIKLIKATVKEDI